MTQIKILKFNPHPQLVADNFTPVVRPGLAFDVGDMFHNEMHVLLLCMTASRNATYERMIQYARQQYIDNNVDDDIAQVILYHTIHREYAHSGNANDMWNERTNYNGLLQYPSINIVMTWVISAMFAQSNRFLKINSADLMALERRTSTDFLFEPIQEPSGMENSSRTGNLLVAQMANIADQIGATAQHLEDTLRRQERSARSEVQSPPVEASTESAVEETPELIDPTNMSLEQLARRAYEMNTGNAPFPTNAYSTFWTAPPPVSLTTLYSMVELPPASRTFLIESFLDIYNAQMSMLSIHFYVRRIATLWQKNDDVIEQALFSKELVFLKTTLSSFVEKIFHVFSIRFLAMEGINLTGAKNVESVFEMFTGRQGRPIIDIDKYLSGVLETLRDGCVGLNRLRVSLLYGRAHPSYVGDDFLSSFLYRNYLTRHAGVAMETITAINPTLATMTLPVDQKRNNVFITELFGQSLESAQQHGVIEPESRRHFDERVVTLVGGEVSSGQTRSMPTTGELASLFERTPMGDSLLGVVERMWTHSAVLHMEQPDEIVPVDEVVPETPANDPVDVVE